MSSRGLPDGGLPDGGGSHTLPGGLSAASASKPSASVMASARTTGGFGFPYQAYSARTSATTSNSRSRANRLLTLFFSSPVTGRPPMGASVPPGGAGRRGG